MASFTLHGIPVSRGIAIGRAHLLRPAARDVKHYLVAEERLEAEVDRLSSAIERVNEELRVLRRDLPMDAPTELAAFIDVHALILADPIISEEQVRMIRRRHYNPCHLYDAYRSEEPTPLHAGGRWLPPNNTSIVHPT